MMLRQLNGEELGQCLIPLNLKSLSMSAIGRELKIIMEMVWVTLFINQKTRTPTKKGRKRKDTFTQPPQMFTSSSLRLVITYIKVLRIILAIGLLHTTAVLYDMEAQLVLITII